MPATWNLTNKHIFSKIGRSHHTDGYNLYIFNICISSWAKLKNLNLQKQFCAGSSNPPHIYFSITLAASLYFILPSTQVNIHHSPCPPTHPFLGVISVHPTTHPSIIHSFICSSYYTGACLGRVFFFQFDSPKDKVLLRLTASRSDRSR